MSFQHQPQSEVKNMTDLCVIIITYNSERYIRSCLTSLYKELNSFPQSSGVIVIDNASIDGTVRLVNKMKINSQTLLIRNNINIGFSRAVNKGIETVKAKNYLLLNPDTEIKSGAIKELYTTTQKYKPCIVGGRHLKMNGVGIHKTDVTIPNILTMLFDYSNLRKLIPFDYFHKKHYYLTDQKDISITEVGAVSGGFMLLSGDAVNKIGKFDENFFMYLEDVDYCKRAHDKGIRVISNPNAHINHFGGGSSRNRYRTNLSAWSLSRKYYATKHFGPLLGRFIKSVYFLDDIICRFKKI